MIIMHKGRENRAKTEHSLTYSLNCIGINLNESVLSYRVINHSEITEKYTVKEMTRN